jgi:hypothetical protein
MKRLVLVLLVALFALGLVFKPSASYAVEAKVGINMMGDWWKPAFLKFEQEEAAKLFGKNMEHDSDGSFMFGPMFWVNVASGWNIGGQMLFGLSRNEFKNTTAAIDWKILPILPYGYIDVSESKCRRYDLDLYAEHPVHKFFDLVIGLRFNYDDGEGTGWRLWPDYKKYEYSAWYFGPSAGVQFHYEFVKGLVLSTGIALTFQFGQYDNEKKFLDSFLFLIPYEYKVGYVCIGFDMNVKLAYLIAPAHLEVFVGGRYQVLPHIGASDDSPALDLAYKNNWINGEVEHWGGIFFGAAYKI